MSASKKNDKYQKGSEKFSSKTKKHPKANLENYSKLFVQLGLVLSLLIVYILIQNKTFEKEVIAFNYNPNELIDDTPEIIVFKIKQKPIPKKKVILVVIKKLDNDTDKEEDIIDVIDVDEPIEDPVFIEADPIVEDIIDEVPFLILEDVPVFPGCKGTNEERKDCFTKKISKFVNRKFDSGLAEELGLPTGIQRIFILFKIDKNGNITDVQARAPHKKLQDEAIRVINLLPKMEPGKQRGKPVNVKYSLPITFKIQ